MATTALNLITDALTKLGIYAQGEPISAPDETQSLITLNDMIDEWANDNLYVYQVTPVEVDLTSGIDSYSLASRYPRLETGPGRATCTISSVESEVNIVSAIEWNVIYSLYTGEGTPDTLFYDPQYPVGIVNVRPIPNKTGTLNFNAWFDPLVAFADGAEEVTLAEGADEALKTNLAVALKPYFTTAQLDPSIIAAAAASKTALRQYSMTSRAMIQRQRVRIPNANSP
jgi:hypothetical protein